MPFYWSATARNKRDTDITTQLSGGQKINCACHRIEIIFKWESKGSLDFKKKSDPPYFPENVPKSQIKKNKA